MHDNYRRGENHPRATLSDAQVSHFKALRVAGWSRRAAAQEAGINLYTARDIDRGKLRNHTPRSTPTLAEGSTL